MELSGQTEVISSRTSNVERPREGPLGHRTLEKIAQGNKNQLAECCYQY